MLNVIIKLHTPGNVSMNFMLIYIPINIKKLSNSVKIHMEVNILSVFSANFEGCGL